MASSLFPPFLFFFSSGFVLGKNVLLTSPHVAFHKTSLSEISPVSSRAPPRLSSHLHPLFYPLLFLNRPLSIDYLNQRTSNLKERGLTKHRYNFDRGVETGRFVNPSAWSWRGEGGKGQKERKHKAEHLCKADWVAENRVGMISRGW